jgi:hypothetical protein
VALSHRRAKNAVNVDSAKQWGIMATIDVVRGDLLLTSDWSELNRIANKRGPKAVQKAFEELARSNPECFSRLVAALSPDGRRELATKTLLDLVAEAREPQEPRGNAEPCWR